MKSSCAFYERYRTHKVPSFSDYRYDSETAWQETEEGKTHHHKESIAFPVRVEVPLATKERRRAGRAKVDKEHENEVGKENAMTKEIVVKSWPAHVVETLGQQGGWIWLLRLFCNCCKWKTLRIVCCRLALKNLSRPRRRSRSCLIPCTKKWRHRLYPLNAFSSM